MSISGSGGEGDAGPPVAVVVPCHNAEKTVARALESVFSQNYPALEIVAVDDSSTDATAEILQTYTHRGLRLIRTDGVRGAAGARNAGVRAAHSDYIAFLDADDEWLPGKLAQQMDVIEAEPHMTFVACRSRFVDLEGRLIEDLYNRAAPSRGVEAWRTLLAYNFVATPAVLLRRSAFVRIGGFDETLPIAEDQDLWIRLALSGPIGFIDAPLLVVHASADSLSTRYNERRAEFEYAVIRRHVDQLGSRLSFAERQHILGCRASRIGRSAYKHDKRTGLRLLLRAILSGYEPFTNLAYLLTETAIGHRIRDLLRYRGGAPSSQ